nr:sensor histidine kinase [uncultured Paracoccus sp.]
MEIAVTRDGSSWHCTVADRGPGIAPDDRAHALNRFYRGKQAHPGGSGLGLAIVATAMERLGGELRLEERQGGGELATLVLPASD